MKSQLWGSLLLLGVALLPGSARASVINFDNLGQNTVTSGMVTPTIPPDPAGSGVVIVSTQYQASLGVTFSDCLTSSEVAGACPSFSLPNNNYVVVVESGTSYATNPPTTDGYTTPNIIALATVATNPNTNPTTATLVTNNAGTSSGVSLIVTFTNAASNLMFDTYGNDSTPTGQQFAQASVTFNNGLSTATIGLLTTTGGTNPFNGKFPDPINLSAFPNITRLEIFNDTDINGTAFDNFSFTSASLGAPEPSPLVLVGFGGLLLVVRGFLARKR